MACTSPTLRSVAIPMTFESIDWDEIEREDEEDAESE
jgi:hypothetical protein